MRAFEADYCDELVEKQAAELAAKDALIALLLGVLEDSIEVFKALAVSHHEKLLVRNTNHTGGLYDCNASTCKISQNKIKRIEAAITKAKAKP